MSLDDNSAAAKAMYEHVDCCRYGAMELPGYGQVANTVWWPGGLVLVVDGTGTGTGSNTSMEIWVSCLVVPIHHDNLSLKSKMHTYINQFLIS